MSSRWLGMREPAKAEREVKHVHCVRPGLARRDFVSVKSTRWHRGLGGPTVPSEGAQPPRGSARWTLETMQHRRMLVLSLQRLRGPQGRA